MAEGRAATVASDPLDPARAAALAVALGLPFAPGAPLFPIAHRVYFWEPMPEVGLGPDGHPRPGGLIPDLGLPRRMWAGGRLEFRAPLWPGRAAEKRTVCEGAVRKAGRSGPLGLVTLRHEIRQDGALAVSEWQELVFRAAFEPGVPAPVPPVAPNGADETETRVFSTTALFRYSALTLNGHRIHYDADYARAAEGYGGLVVHGPLLAQCLMLMAARQGPLTWFSYRATAPLLRGERAEFCRRGDRLWVREPEGRLCMEAEAG